MSNPYEQYNSGQPQQPGHGQPPQFGQQPQPDYGQAPQFGQQPQDAAPGYGQPPQFGQQAQFGQQPQPGYGQPTPEAGYGQGVPPFGQSPEAPAWGQGVPQQPTAPYVYSGTPMQGTKSKRTPAIISAAVVLVIIGGFVAFHVATTHTAQRGSSGTVSQAGSMQAADLKVGDCFDNPTADSNIESITAIPCTQPHDSQVFAEPPVTESSYPGDTTLSSEASDDCNDSSTQSTISSDAPQSLEVSALYAQDEESFDNGNNYITCFIVADSKNLTKSYVTAN